MKAIFNISTRTKAGAVFVCFLACFLMVLLLNGCASPGTADSVNPAGGGDKKGGKGRGGRRSLDAGGPAPVVVAKVTQKDVPINVAGVGNVEAYSTISVLPQVGGQLTEVFFKEGDIVKKGEKLFTIDPRPLQAQLQQSIANLAKDKALAAQAQANLARDLASEKYARAESQRYAKLFDDGIVSKEQGDQYLTNADTLAQSVMADRAAIDSAQAQAAADEATIENARLQLSYSTILSPIDGKTGNMTVKLGNVVVPNSTVLETITELEPIYVTFAVPEANLPDIKRYMAERKLPVVAKTQDGDAVEQGVLTFIDNSVDMTTGTIKLKGTFPNTDHKLWPGQYVNATLQLTVRPNALVVPNEAVQSGQDGNFVYVVKDDNTVEARNVVTGPRVDQDLVIEKGLEEGDTVVTEGQLRLAPGSPVQIRSGSDDSGPPPTPGGRGGRGRRGKSS